MLKVFVYGTLKPGQVNFARYCGGDRMLATLPAQVHGKLFELSLGYPAMTLGDTWVKGFSTSQRCAAPSISSRPEGSDQSKV